MKSPDKLLDGHALALALQLPRSDQQLTSSVRDTTLFLWCGDRRMRAKYTVSKRALNP